MEEKENKEEIKSAKDAMIFVYKSGIFSYLVSILELLVGAFWLYIFVRFLSKNGYYGIIASGVFSVVILVIIIFRENIKFEIQGTTLRYYKNKKLVKVYDLKTAEITYKSVQQDASYTDIDLYINGEEIDCLPLRGKFFKMYDKIKEIQGEKVTKIN